MSSEKDLSPSTKTGRHEQLRQLQHDMKTYLGVVTMGLQALEVVREDPEEFAELSQTIAEEGVEPLKQVVAEIVDLAMNEQE
ncbi:hypothetical protein [Thalassoglobus polymorphus]|uniref:Signal transduction histidine kinase dimerisation/phosphoacceptor domain-containing protein n=1 Tax=Thalassoglobus polymorphus TaxID=2527994 RepID=A0A517QNR2_9PLAN|nr:hypothetical protein [Thalassoglobus polymorphus]QDT33265.1 hypothetical protein Mal48_25180 [Thalassoglobus polymorphus]